MATSARRSWLKSIELDLDPSDLDTKDRKVICGSRLDWQEQFQQAMRFGTTHPTASDVLIACGSDLHQANKRHLVDVGWPEELTPILVHLQLDELIVNIDCSICQGTCCTLYAGALLAFRKGFALALPLSLKIFGLFEATNAGYFEAEEFYGDNLDVDDSTEDDATEISVDERQPPEAIVDNLIKRWSGTAAVLI